MEIQECSCVTEKVEARHPALAERIVVWEIVEPCPKHVRLKLYKDWWEHMSHG